jgi:Trk-type K+ transport system membrane component
MKKTFLFLCFALCFVALFTACLEPAGSDDLFSPPSWIRGTWGDSTAHYVYTFTTRDIAMTSGFSRTAGFSVLYENKNVVKPSPIVCMNLR